MGSIQAVLFHGSQVPVANARPVDHFIDDVKYQRLLMFTQKNREKSHNHGGGFLREKKRKQSFNGRSDLPNGLHFESTTKRVKPGAVNMSKSPSKYTGSASLLSEDQRRILKGRSNLPIWPHVGEIRLALHEKEVLILAGETGSGKSTQVPQILLNEPWCKRMIGVTQPRRVAAISLARRVAQEQGTPLGSSSPASTVGYSVRFDNNTSPRTRIKYLTEGVLLQEMIRDPLLEDYSCVVLDEVHERTINADLILGFIRRIIGINKERTENPKGSKDIPLRVVVMSATANMRAIFNFFKNSFPQYQPGQGAQLRSFNSLRVAINGIESESKASKERKQTVDDDDDGGSESSWSGFSSSENEITTIPNQLFDGEDGDVELFSENISTCFIEGRQFPVETFFLPDPIEDLQEAALKAIFQIHTKEPLPGDIIVFLTGQDEVESLEAQVNDLSHDLGPDIPAVQAMPLFASLPHAAQQAVFQATPPRTRKIVLATNIAETSVTIPGVRYVIDCGLAKVREFRSQLSIDSLLVKPISKSSALQRRGRAGREAPGKCYCLYTEAEYSKLQPAARPEILRCDLSAALLILKARGIKDITAFPFFDHPETVTMMKALLQLHQLQALDDDCKMTLKGQRMARLPLSPAMARVLISAKTLVALWK